MLQREIWMLYMDCTDPASAVRGNIFCEQDLVYMYKPYLHFCRKWGGGGVNICVLTKKYLYQKRHAILIKKPYRKRSLQMLRCRTFVQSANKDVIYQFELFRLIKTMYSFSMNELYL